jgi:predicted nucleic acid-binding protein
MKALRNNGVPTGAHGVEGAVEVDCIGLVERRMDALHIACAIEWGADVFLSADARQLAAARRAGLKTKQT